MSYGPLVRTEVEHIVLEKLRVGSTMVVNEATLSRHRNFDFMDELVYRLESYVLAEKLVGDTYEHTVYYTVPASWWQHFKQDYADRWWLRWLVDRRPVRSRTHKVTEPVTFERYATYPNARIKTPDSLGSAVILEQVKAR